MNHKKMLLMIFAVLLTSLFLLGRYYRGQGLKSRTLLLSHSFGQQHPLHQFLVNFNQKLTAKSGNKMKLVIYDSAQLGAEPQFTEQIRLGILDGGIVSNPMLTKFSPDFIFLQYPYMFKNELETRHFLNNFAEKELSESLNRRNCNLSLCCSLTNGMNGFYFAGSPKDFQLRNRNDTMYLTGSISPFCMECFSDFGFLSVPVAKGEIYSALQMKMIDAGENTLPGLIASKHCETAKVFVPTNHSSSIFYLAFNSRLMNNLSHRERIWLCEAFEEAKEKYEAMQNANLRQLARKNDVSIVTLSPQDEDALRQKAAAELKKAIKFPWREIFWAERKQMEGLQQ